MINLVKLEDIQIDCFTNNHILYNLSILQLFCKENEVAYLPLDQWIVNRNIGINEIINELYYIIRYKNNIKNENYLLFGTHNTKFKVINILDHKEIIHFMVKDELTEIESKFKDILKQLHEVELVEIS